MDQKKSQTLNLITTNMATNNARCESVKMQNMSSSRKKKKQNIFAFKK